MKVRKTAYLQCAQLGGKSGCFPYLKLRCALDRFLVGHCCYLAKKVEAKKPISRKKNGDIRLQ
jgi:hypothetical protein